MAVASQSLFNMTVASDNAGGNQGLLMPKLQYRFRVLFSNIGTTNDGLELTKQVIDCSRPQVSFGEITLPVYNSTIYLAGRHEWQALTVNIRDDAQGSVAKVVGHYKFETDIEILDGGNGNYAPAVLERWELMGCFIQQANYNTLNYGTNDVVTISLTIRFDNAVQSPLSSGIGTDIGRILGGASTTGIGSGNG